MDKFASQNQMLYLILAGSIRRKPPGVRVSHKNAIQRNKNWHVTRLETEIST
jgi:hypothetical protein